MFDEYQWSHITNQCYVSKPALLGNIELRLLIKLLHLKLKSSNFNAQSNFLNNEADFKASVPAICSKKPVIWVVISKYKLDGGFVTVTSRITSWHTRATWILHKSIRAIKLLIGTTLQTKFCERLYNREACQRRAWRMTEKVKFCVVNSANADGQTEVIVNDYSDVIVTW